MSIQFVPPSTLFSHWYEIVPEPPDAATELEKAAAEKHAEAEATGEKLGGLTVKLTQKAGVDGRLFGSVTNHDIADELNKQGFKIHKSQIRMPNGHLKTVGDSQVTISLHTDVAVEVTVAIYGETA